MATARWAVATVARAVAAAAAARVETAVAMAALEE